MEWMYEGIGEIIIALIGIALTFLVSKLGGVLGAFWKNKLWSENAQSVARTVVRAVEMMYREQKGEEKLEKALELAESMLQSRGIRLEKEQMRIFLEAALAEFKTAFREA